MGHAYSIYETKTRLSELLRSVKSGRELVVTERGRAIAKLVPYQEPETLEERLNRLEAEGRLLRRQLVKVKALPGKRRPGALKRFLRDR